MARKRRLSDGDDSDLECQDDGDDDEMVGTSFRGKLRMVVPPESDRHAMGSFFVEKAVAVAPENAKYMETFNMAAQHFMELGDKYLKEHVMPFIRESDEGNNAFPSVFENFKNTMVTKSGAHALQEMPLFRPMNGAIERYGDRVFPPNVVERNGTVNFADLYKSIMRRHKREGLAIYRRQGSPTVFLSYNDRIYHTSFAQLFLVFILSVCGVTDYLLKHNTKPPQKANYAEGSLRSSKRKMKHPRGRAALIPSISFGERTTTFGDDSDSDF